MRNTTGPAAEKEAARKQRIQSQTERRVQKSWQRMMSILLYIPAFFSLLTCYIALRDAEIKAVLVFGVSTVLFGAVGTLLWRGDNIDPIKKFLTYLKF